LKLDKKINKLENIAVRSVDIVEAWQESGKDYITSEGLCQFVWIIPLIETTGQVVSGSKQSLLNLKSTGHLPDR